MKRVLLISALLISLAGAGQHYIQASIQQGSTSNSVNILFSPNYTNAPTELVNYLSLSIAIPAASASGVVPALTMTGPFAGLQMIKAIPFSYLQGTDSIYSWVYLSGPSSMSWTNGVPFVGATITFTGGTGSSKIKLVDFTNKSGGANTNTLYVIVTNNPPFDVANYSSLFYPINGTNGSVTGTDAEVDQFVQTNQAIFLSNFCPSPVTPVVSGISTTGATVTWNAVPGVTGYEIELSTSPTPTGGSITSGLSYSRNDLAIGIAYYFHIRSICSPGNYSGWVRSDFATICPTSTSITTDSITPSGVKIKWLPVAAAGQGYQYAVTSGQGTPSPSSIIPTLIDSVAVSGLIEGTTYYAQVRVNCSPSVYSEWVSKSFTTTFPACLAPDKIIVSNVSNSADISWPAVPKAAGYEYVVSTSSSLPASGIPTILNNLHIAGLESNTNYYVYVRTVCGPGRYSPWTLQTFVSSCFPVTPFLVRNSPAMGTADLAWRKIKGALGYEYAILSGSNPPGGTTNFTSDTMMVAQHLIPGSKYFLHIRTQCAASVVSPWRTLEFHTSGINVIPDNSSRTLNITIYGSELQNEELAVFDGLGRLLKKTILTGNSTKIELKGYSSGLYLIKYGNRSKYVTKVMLR